MFVLIQGAACFLDDESMFAWATVFAWSSVAVESRKSLKDLPDLSN
jgi:hypothetical protein